MTVLRRLDAVLEPTKQAVLDMRASLDQAQIVNQDPALRQAAAEAFYNTSKFTLRERSRMLLGRRRSPPTPRVRLTEPGLSGYPARSPDPCRIPLRARQRALATVPGGA
jgi:hypothetical protein